MSRTRTLSIVVLALVVSSAVMGSLIVESAGAATTISGARSTTPKAGTGTVSGTNVCVPYWAKSVSHHFELTDAAGTVVDSFDYTVPAEEKTETITTKNGVSIAIKTIHSGGVNGSPSQGCFEYVVKTPSAKKTTNKKNSKKKK